MKNFPSIQSFLEDEDIKKVGQELSIPLVSSVIKQTVQSFKENFSFKEDSLIKEDLFEQVKIQILKETNLLLKGKTSSVINATGIALHTNMGRSPLNSLIWDKAKKANIGYSSLELDLLTGKRGKRKSLVPHLLKCLTGCDNALLVNNNAAALFLLLSSVAKGKEVIISRGELVQIGGGFRIPDILELSGAILKEVGTTNITSLKDYENALTENTAMILKVHSSNFKIEGFTASPSTKELSQICPPYVSLVVDQGSGVLKQDILGEVSVQNHLKQGAHLVLFSSDKCLGGPQGGLLVGKDSLIKTIESHQLFRTFRVSKIISTLLEEHLIALLNQNYKPWAEDVIDQKIEKLQAKSQVLKNTLGDFISIIPTKRTIGGGSTPNEFKDSVGITLHSKKSADKTLMLLRNLSIPIIAYIVEGQVVCDLACLTDSDLEYLKESLLKLKEI